MVTRFFGTLCAFVLTLLGISGAAAANPPRLVINIVVGSMNAEALQRCSAGFGEGGFRKLVDEGAVFADARFDCMQTVTPASLATLSTGALPPVHGVIAEQWFDYTTGRRTGLTDDSREIDFDLRDGKPGHSPRQLTAPTLAEMMMRADSSSRIVSLAVTPASSITLTGKKGLCFWMDAERCRWTTSSYYTPLLPSWVKSYNAEDLHARYLTGQWQPREEKSKYANTRSAVLFGNSAPAKSDFDKVCRTPIGNTVLFDFAKYAVKCLNMGNDEHPDLLNICLDTSAEIAERYGIESVEYEDMLWRLDSDIKEFLAYINVHLRDKESLLVVLTSAHGSAPVHNAAEADRFNVPQFEVIMNAYLNAKYGPGEWILGYVDRSLYLNRELIDEKRLPLAAVQNETAAFALRFRGVAHALSSTMLQSGSFADGYGRKMQNGFYPRRSGDVLIDLMPEWTAERDGYVSQSGSMYGYDTHVPLIFCGAGIAPKTYAEPVTMTAVAPTIAHILGLGELPASEAKPLITE